jgi:hypothetical protein
MELIAAQSNHKRTNWRLIAIAVVSSMTAAALIVAVPAEAASSPTVVGQKYSDARGSLSSAGYSVVVSTTVGDQLQRDDCVVTRQQDRTVPPPENTGASATKQTLLSLNCDAAVASATKPGNSLASPAGAAAAAAAKAAAASTSPTVSPDHH